MDLRGAVTALTPALSSKAILAPAGEDKALLSAIEKLRADGQIVIQALPNSTSDIVELNCDKQLIYINNQWQIESFKSV